MNIVDHLQSNQRGLFDCNWTVELCELQNYVYYYFISTHTKAVDKNTIMIVYKVTKENCNKFMRCKCCICTVTKAKEYGRSYVVCFVVDLVI